MTLGILAAQTARVFAWFCLCVALMLGADILIKKCVKVPEDIFRKMLHGIAFGMSLPLVLMSESWQATAACMGVIMLLAFFALTAISRFSWYSSFFVEKEQGEIRTSMILLLTMQIMVVLILWGLRGEPVYAVTAIWMWGTGDAAAAIVGRRLGKHRIGWKIADNNKSFEGTAACFIASFIAGAVMAALRAGGVSAACLGISFAAAAVCALVEMVCRRGTDTFFVPLAVTAVLFFFG